MQNAQVQDRMIEKAINILTATGCEFKVISPTGWEYGELNVEDIEEKPKRRIGKPRNDFVSLIKQHIPDQGVVGEVYIMPTFGFNKSSLRSSVVWRLDRLWGENSYELSVNGKQIEILCVSEPRMRQAA
jgi:hypothetical protein